ncbi:MAG: ABC transporter permease subunit [Firmicutes bacterium]|jgi:ABC-2 type transport system permease protein|nr:ABC transporter permease subunit [Bacillota bacterium]NBI63278.1 ABC transporter permease [Clostridiales bacterium]
MSKLLSANFMRLRKNKVFWGGILFMAAAGIYYPIGRYIGMKHDGYTAHLEDGFFICAVFAAVLLSVFCSLFVGTEYSDGTIRNKIIIGHKRTDLYLSNLLTNMATGAVMCMVWFAAYLCAGIPLLGFFQVRGAVILLLTIAVLLLSCAFSALFTMVSMLNASKAGAAVICMLVAFLLLFTGTYLNARLQEPETYPVYDYVVVGEDAADMAAGMQEVAAEEKNPHYVGGTKRKVYEFLYDFMPGGQAVQCSSMESERPHVLCLYSGIIFIIATSIGMAVFRRKDIK